MRICTLAICLFFLLTTICSADIVGEIQSARGFFSLGVMYLDDDAPKITEKWVEPEITSEIRSDFPNGNAAVLVITKIRDDLPKNDSVLERVKNRISVLQKTYGEEKVKITEKAENNSKILQVNYRDIVYDEYTPYGIGFTKSDSIGISQYLVRRGYLVELFVFLKNNSDTPILELEPVIIDLCDEFRSSLKISI